MTGEEVGDMIEDSIAITRLFAIRLRWFQGILFGAWIVIGAIRGYLQI